MANPTEKKQIEPLGLVGRYFHTFREQSGPRVMDYQGTVRGDLGHGFFLVQFFEWMSGEPSTLAVEHLSQMSKWQFYLDSAQMKDWSSLEGNSHGRRSGSR